MIDSLQSSAAGAPQLGERLQRVRSAIDDAARAHDRSADDITLIVVTKFHPASLVRELIDLGVHDFGENRHQEASAKARELADQPISWHFVGQLQSNKAKAVREYAHAVHSLDRDSVVTALGTAGQAELDCFIQLNLTDDARRGGVGSDGLEALAERVIAQPSLRLRGVMAVAPLGEDPRRAFEQVRLMSQRLQLLAPDATRISAGMSHDFVDAIAEGATHLRIGSAITGIRPAQG